MTTEWAPRPALTSRKHVSRERGGAPRVVLSVVKTCESCGDCVCQFLLSVSSGQRANFTLLCGAFMERNSFVSCLESNAPSLGGRMVCGGKPDVMLLKLCLERRNCGSILAAALFLLTCEDRRLFFVEGVLHACRAIIAP